MSVAILAQSMLAQTILAQATWMLVALASRTAGSRTIPWCIGCFPFSLIYDIDAMVSAELVDFTNTIGRVYRLKRRGLPSAVQFALREFMGVLRSHLLPAEGCSTTTSLGGARRDIQAIMDSIVGLAQPAPHGPWPSPSSTTATTTRTSTTTTTRTSTTATRAPATTTPSPPQTFTIYSDEESEDADALDHRLATSEEDAASSRWCTLPSRAFSGRVWAAKPSAACTSRWPPSRASSSSRARAFRVRDVHDDDSSSSELDLADLPALLGAGIQPSELLARSRLTIAAREALMRGPVDRPVDYSRWDAFAREVELEEAFDDVLWPGAFADAEREAAETGRATHSLLPAPGDELAEFVFVPDDYYGSAFF